jgi:hypothetical protein
MFLNWNLSYGLIHKTFQNSKGKGEAIPLHAYKGVGGEEVQLLLIHHLGSRWR